MINWLNGNHCLPKANMFTLHADLSHNYGKEKSNLSDGWHNYNKHNDVYFVNNGKIIARIVKHEFNMLEQDSMNFSTTFNYYKSNAAMFYKNLNDAKHALEQDWIRLANDL